MAGLTRLEHRERALSPPLALTRRSPPAAPGGEHDRPVGSPSPTVPERCVGETCGVPPAAGTSGACRRRRKRSSGYPATRTVTRILGSRVERAPMPSRGLTHRS